eukprot:m.20642 g.20642  ORF g.20642 m.20642 type:complete len:925 (-) comp7892_c1_seq1:24-2798(-)
MAQTDRFLLPEGDGPPLHRDRHRASDSSFLPLAESIHLHQQQQHCIARPMASLSHDSGPALMTPAEAPFRGLPLGSRAYETDERTSTTISSHIRGQSSTARVEHVYHIQNLIHMLSFLHTLLLWASALVFSATRQNESVTSAVPTTACTTAAASPGKMPPTSSDTKRSKHSDSDPIAPPSDTVFDPVTDSVTATTHRDDESSPGADIFGPHSLSAYNTLTSATLILRKLRRELKACKSKENISSLVHFSRLRNFIAQADATIVGLLESIDFTPLITADSFPPEPVLESLGLSKRLCQLANIQLLYHTPGVFPEKLFENGIDIRYSKIGSFGRGAYFSDNALKAMAYFRPEWNVKSDKHHPEHHYMAISLVALGRIKKYEDKISEQTLFCEPENFDSVMGNPRDQRELVVFNSARVLLSYIVYYKTTTLPAPPPSLPTGLMIPTALKDFFTKLIARAESMQLGPDVRGFIADLLSGKLPPADFVNTVSTKLNAPPPADLVANLTKQISRVHSNAPPASAPPAAAAAAAPVSVSAPSPAPLMQAPFPSRNPAGSDSGIALSSPSATLPPTPPLVPGFPLPARPLNHFSNLISGQPPAHLAAPPQASGDGSNSSNMSLGPASNISSGTPWSVGSTRDSGLPASNFSLAPSSDPSPTLSGVSGGPPFPAQPFPAPQRTSAAPTGMSTRVPPPFPTPSSLSLNAPSSLASPLVSATGIVPPNQPQDSGFFSGPASITGLRTHDSSLGSLPNQQGSAPGSAPALPSPPFPSAAATTPASSPPFRGPPFPSSRPPFPSTTPPFPSAGPPFPSAGRDVPRLSAPAAIPVRKATVSLPRSLKLFFEDIRGRVKQPADRGRVDQAIFDLVGGTITAQQFLTNMGRIIGAAPPVDLADQLQQQVNLAQFRCQSSKSMKDPVEDSDAEADAPASSA